MREETVQRLMDRRKSRRRQRIVGIIKTIASAVYLVACISYLIALEFPVSAEFPTSVESPAMRKKTMVYAVEFPPEYQEPDVINLGEFKITHYCACTKCCGKWADGITATGTKATEGRTIAVDPNVIPYGTEVTIRYADGTEHTYIAEDCGGAIKGNRIDVYMDSHGAALEAGVKYGDVFLEGEQ